MKRFFYISSLSWLLPFICLGQGATNKAGKQLPISFYSDTHLKHDIAIIKGKEVNYHNSQNKIIAEIKNPEGTIVLDGKKELQESKELLDNPDKILFKENYAEIPFQNGSEKYRIPITNYSKHHLLSSSEVMSGANVFIEECTHRYGEIPSLITLKHNDDFNYCEFAGFSSLSNLYDDKPIYQAALNLRCVFLEKFYREFNNYATR